MFHLKYIILLRSSTQPVQFCEVSRRRRRPPQNKGLCAVHPRTKWAAREGHWWSLKGIAGSPNTPLWTGGGESAISPFRPHQSPRGSTKPSGAVPTALAMPRGLMGVGPAQGAALFRIWSTDGGPFARFERFHAIFTVKSTFLSRQVPHLCSRPGTAPPLAQDPPPRVPWARLRRWAPVPAAWWTNAVSGAACRGEIALLPPPVQRGVLGDPAIPFKLPQ